MSDVRGFVRASGRNIVNGDGKPFLLRGVGLGSWLLPEGYMWRMPAGADRPRRMEALVADLLGEEAAGQFWNSYWDRFCTEDDIARIAAEGFNSIRLPISARYLTGADDAEACIPQRIARIDTLLAWCREHRLYVILDLHGAPGGQTGTNIDDSAHDSPDLFIDAANQDRTVAIWRTLAERYRDEWIVAGYDLLNEPLPEWFSQYNDRVMPLYRRITEAIREVDRRHMIILEGVHWATDWSIFTEMFDDNVMLQFHKYWNNPDRESLTPYLAARERLNVPIFMGEGGENNTDWYAGAFRLFDELDISWNFWTWKKLDTTNSPASIRRPEGWESIAAYAGGGARPDVEQARGSLAAFLRNIELARCEYHVEVVNALFRRPPVRIPAIFYSCDARGRGLDGASDGAGARGADASGVHVPVVGFRTGDGTSLGYVAPATDAPGPPNFAHNGGEAWKPEEWMYLLLDSGGWAAYDFTHRDEGIARFLVCLTMAWAAGDAPGAAVSIGVDAPSQEFVVYPEGQDGGYNDYWVEIAAASGLRRLTVRAHSAAVRVQAVCVTIA